MTNLFLYGTTVPVLVIGYVFIARMVARWAYGRWACHFTYDDDGGGQTMFAVFWPIAIPIWALFTFMLIPMWHSWDGLGDKVEELSKKHRPEE